MKVIRAKNSGFCFGVKTAVDTAVSLLSAKEDGKRLIMLGELTHNENVVNELLEGGFSIVHSASEVPEGSKVIIRAHGVTPSEKAILAGKNCEIIDRTCPFVNKIHDIVRDASREGLAVIVAGTKGHPEVVGICGEAPEDMVTVISSPEEVFDLQIPPCGAILVSQTTFSKSIFDKICENVENKFEKIRIFGTICSTTEIRQREAAELAEHSDAMIVIGSSGSSNTRKLYDVCRSRCDRTYLVADVTGIEVLIAKGELRDSDNVGVTAGASTPEAIILEVVRRMDENKNENMTNQIEADIDFQEYVEGIAQLRRNAIVKGAITSADADYVYVDVRDKSEGKIPRREFANDPDFDLDAAIASKAEITVMVKSIRNTDQGKEIILSKSQLDYEKNKKIVTEAFENKTPINVTVTGVVKDGVIANFGGID
ncbi:MAG: 4-hydroxy-3-methylbut-2-enyl diphosphate reductase, partial [Clostridiales bacterium]|nr:4-hydroxy-3-methylbut-2-enyl diphosphate reductase [Clostridiales bacterium]